MSAEISILISTFGASHWNNLALERAHPSALNQGAEVLVHHLANGTLAQARNENAARAQGEYLVFLDADDELEPGFCDAMRAAVEATKVAPKGATFLYTPAVCYARRGSRPRAKIWPRMDFKVGNWCIIGTMIEKSVFEKIGGFREYELYEDYALWAMAEAHAGAMVEEVEDAVYVAHWSRKSRNRTPGPCERLYWHQRIGRDVWPTHFDDLSPTEDETHCLASGHLRFL